MMTEQKEKALCKIYEKIQEDAKTLIYLITLEKNMASSHEDLHTEIFVASSRMENNCHIANKLFIK